MPEITLRPALASDAGSIMSWINDDEVVKNFRHLPGNITEREEEFYISCMGWSNKDALYVILLDGEIIGTAGIHDIDNDHKHGRAGIMIGVKEHWGMGYGNTVMALIQKEAFEVIELNKLWAACLSSNTKMRHLISKSGMMYSGYMAEHYHLHGKFHDMSRYSITKREYKRREQLCTSPKTSQDISPTPRSTT